jgi:hypothetical protein
MSPASADKRQREKTRKEKAEAKAARRLERSAATPEPGPDPLPPVDEEALLAELAEIHTRFEDGDLDYDDFAAAKDGLTRRLRVE